MLRAEDSFYAEQEFVEAFSACEMMEEVSEESAKQEDWGSEVEVKFLQLS